MKKIALLVGLVALVGACSSEPSTAPPYKPGEITFIGSNLALRSIHLSECGDACDEVYERCQPGAAAEVLFDQNGTVADVICYERHVNVVYVDDAPASDITVGNNTVVVLDGSDDGVDVDGDVTLQGNNSILYGAGPDVSVVGGTLLVEKNNAIVHGVRIRSDVTISKNNAQLSSCVIEGDLTILGNNTTLAECQVWGKLTIMGVNTTLVSNQLGQPVVVGKNLSCNQNKVVASALPSTVGSADAGPSMDAAAEGLDSTNQPSLAVNCVEE